MRLTADSESTRPKGATVFVSDPSAEAERVAQSLRGGGFVVVDVPLSMLVARVAVQRPRVILVDADADGALQAIARMRELPEAEHVDVLFIGRVGVAFTSAEDALAHEGSGFFARPVDVAAVVKRIETLTLGSVSVPPVSHQSFEKKREMAPTVMPTGMA
ncbi:MAG: large Ala/Glu-rich protein, partial [Myxococcaceae bacterium]|nr:large Ala/Glu-rich protein [Myxococcaceae bacterium]